MLDPVGEAAAAARAYVRGRLGQLRREELIDAAVLGVSELVANVCLHARTPFTVAVELVAGWPRIVVTDRSPVLPGQRRHDALATTGRGLRLLSVFGRWGVEGVPDGDGKAVWFEPGNDPDPEPGVDGPFGGLLDREG